MNKRVRLLISGRVQGVMYRRNAQIEAEHLKIFGFAKNLPDGRVEIVAEGSENSLQELIDWCRKGPAFASVEAVEVSWEECKNDFQKFLTK